MSSARGSAGGTAASGAAGGTAVPSRRCCGGGALATARGAAGGTAACGAAGGTAVPSRRCCGGAAVAAARGAARSTAACGTAGGTAVPSRRCDGGGAACGVTKATLRAESWRQSDNATCRRPRQPGSRRPTPRRRQRSRWRGRKRTRAARSSGWRRGRAGHARGARVPSGRWEHGMGSALTRAVLAVGTDLVAVGWMSMPPEARADAASGRGESGGIGVGIASSRPAALLRAKRLAVGTRTVDRGM